MSIYTIVSNKISAQKIEKSTISFDNEVRLTLSEDTKEFKIAEYNTDEVYMSEEQIFKQYNIELKKEEIDNEVEDTIKRLNIAKNISNPMKERNDNIAANRTEKHKILTAKFAAILSGIENI